MKYDRRNAHHFGILTIYALLTASGLAMEPCPSVCRFRICHSNFREGPVLQKENRGYLLGVPNEPLGNFPCLPRRRNGNIVALFNVSGDEARVSRKFRNEFIPISKFMKSEVSPNFRSDYLRFVRGTDGRATIARSISRGNQDEKIDRVCVQLPIRSYSTRSGKQQKAKGKSACVGFQTVVAKLLVNLAWDSPDDLDLSLEEPNGDVINRFGQNRRSENGGRMLRDNGALVCGTSTGQERVSYLRDATIEKGTYSIRIDNNRRCQPITSYKLIVFFDGDVLLHKTGIIADITAPTENVIVETFTIDS